MKQVEHHIVFIYLNKWKSSLVTFVIYWPSTKPSIKRFTGVNERKNSRSRWPLENNITRRPSGSRQSETGCQHENQHENQLAVTNGWATPAKMRKKCCYNQGRTWVNIAVHLYLHLFLSHNKHRPFENKVWEIYFYKEVCSFIIEVVIICLIMFRIYLYTCSCIVAIQHFDLSVTRYLLKNLLHTTHCHKDITYNSNTNTYIDADDSVVSNTNGFINFWL